MARITVNKGNFKIEERELEQGSLDIGRNHDNQLHIDDTAVSNHHAKIITVFESSYVEDLNSTNGTFVNGQKVKTHTLHNGDVLTIGHYQILFQSETAAGNPDANATMMIGVSQLQELTKKARRKEREKLATQKSTAKPTAHKPVSAPATTPKQAVRQPKLKVHENEGQLIPDNTELPDIDDAGNILGKTQTISPEPRVYNRRKSDTSVMPSLKVIALAVLATVATFTLLMMIFK